MDEIKIQTFNELHNLIENYDPRTVIYRGVKSVHYRVGKFIPRHLSRRITTQGGLFTIHPDPYGTFESRDMRKTIIPNSIRSTLKKTLNKYGIDRFALFPSLDSLAAHIEWLQSERY